MEDPVRFDVWGVLTGDGPEDMVRWLATRRTDLDDTNVRIAVNRSRALREPVLVCSSIDWAAVITLRPDLPAWLIDVRVFQEGYGPADASRLEYCAHHDC
jgi:hypothetical protein